MRSSLRYFLLAAAAAAAAFAHAPHAIADEPYPSRHMRLVVPFAVGGPLDISARIVAEKLTGALGQNIVVDNRPGGNGIIGIDLVAKARPDGYTMLMHTGAFTGNMVLYKKLPYDGLRDFAPVTQLVRSYGLVAVVHPALPVRDLKDLVALSRKRPMSYGSSGAGTITHLVAELFNTEAGTRIQHVPYKGSGPALNDVLGRQIEITFAGPSLVLPFIKDERVRPLALSGTERVPVLPDLPTFAEQGFPGVVMTAWYGLWFPAQTPQPIVKRVYADVKRLLETPELKGRFKDLGLVTVGSTPAEFARFIREDIAFQGNIVKRAGIPQQ